jgi:DNA-binding CsgD family transcriptional regulator
MSDSNAARLLMRRNLIDFQQGDIPAAMLDCGAHMLLYLDQPSTVQRIALKHLLHRLRAPRADIGFGSPDEDSYKATTVETQADSGICSNPKSAVPNRHPAVQIVWRSKEPVCLNIVRDPIVGSLRTQTLETGTRAKLACRLEYGTRIFGMVCVDDNDESRRWNTGDLMYLAHFSARFLAPILYASQSMLLENASTPLTAAEVSVARLVAAGFTYKEVGRRLGKSPNTVDNQLRKIRTKLNVKNRVELANACVPWL